MSTGGAKRDLICVTVTSRDGDTTRTVSVTRREAAAIARQILLVLDRYSPVGEDGSYGLPFEEDVHELQRELPGPCAPLRTPYPVRQWYRQGGSTRD